MKELFLEGAGAAASAEDHPQGRAAGAKGSRLGLPCQGGLGVFQYRVTALPSLHCFKANIQNKLMALLAGISQQCARE